MPEDDKKILRRIVCVKLKDDIHSPGEMNGQMMALKEHVKARYRLSRRPGKGQLQDPEPVLQGKEGFALSHG